jgi:hypothetical protein
MWTLSTTRPPGSYSTGAIAANLRPRPTLRSPPWRARNGTLYYGDNLDVLKRHVKDESVDLVYLRPAVQLERDVQRPVSRRRITRRRTRRSRRSATRGGGTPPPRTTTTRSWRPGGASATRCEHSAPSSARATSLLTGDDGPAPGRAPARAQGEREHLPPLRPDRQPLPQDADGRRLRAALLPLGGDLEAHERALQRGAVRPVHDVILFYSTSDSYTWNESSQPYDQTYLDHFDTHRDPD